jgi:hypothetical protein
MCARCKPFNGERLEEIHLTRSILNSFPAPSGPQCFLWIFSASSALNSEKRITLYHANRISSLAASAHTVFSLDTKRVMVLVSSQQ